jgi:hypothetical protein
VSEPRPPKASRARAASHLSDPTVLALARLRRPILKELLRSRPQDELQVADYSVA